MVVSVTKTEAFVGVGKRRNQVILRVLMKIEKKVLPLIFVLFASVYWIYGLTLYFN